MVAPTNPRAPLALLPDAAARSSAKRHDWFLPSRVVWASNAAMKAIIPIVLGFALTAPGISRAGDFFDVPVVASLSAAAVREPLHPAPLPVTSVSPAPVPPAALIPSTPTPTPLTLTTKSLTPVKLGQDGTKSARSVVNVSHSKQRGRWRGEH